MYRKQLFVTLIFLLGSKLIFGQLPKIIFQGDAQENYEPGVFTISKLTAAQSAGVYHFGESEGETDFIVLPYKNGIIIQILGNLWGKNPSTGKDTWLKQYFTFNAVTLQNNTFKFGKYKGILAHYKGKISKAVLLNGDPSSDFTYGPDSAEAGHFNASLAAYFSDKRYPEVSFKLIDEKYLLGKSKQELKYMRNEVFARYGLIFQSPETAALFRKQYIAFRKDVSVYLTAIEKDNLEVIKTYEAKH